MHGNSIVKVLFVEIIVNFKGFVMLLSIFYFYFVIYAAFTILILLLYIDWLWLLQQASLSGVVILRDLGEMMSKYKPGLWGSS